MSGERAVKFHQLTHLAQSPIYAIGKAQVDSRAPQQHHLAVVLGEFREGSRRVDVRHADPPAEWITAGRHAYGLMRDAAAILPGRCREGGFADDLQLGSLTEA